MSAAWQVSLEDLERKVLDRERSPDVATAVRQVLSRLGRHGPKVSLNIALEALSQLESLGLGLSIRICFVRAQLILESAQHAHQQSRDGVR